MRRNALRVTSILFLLFLAVFTPVVSFGYSELKEASTAKTYIEAARHYQSAAQRIPWRADLYELSGHAYYYAKEYANADAVYRKAFERNALSAEGWVAWGDVNYLNNHQQRAVEIWEQGLEQPDPSDHLYSRLAQSYQERAEYLKAAQYLQRYVSAHSDDAAAHYRLGLFLTLSDSNAALSELIAASGLDPQFDPAVETLRSALNLSSLDDSPSVRFVTIGRGLGLVQEWKLARAAFESAVKADGENAEAWAWLGEANQQLGSGGIEELDHALNLNPNSSTVRGLRGLYFQRIGNFREALLEFQSAARLEPNNPAWFVSLGETHSKLGDLIRALEAYQYATAIAPDDAGYWRLLAIFCGQNNVHVKDVGVPAAQQAVVLAQDDAASLDTLGWLLLLDSRYEEAERILLYALEVDPQNAAAHFHLGMLHLQKGDRAAAYEHLVQARDLGNSEAEVLLNQYFP